ncbi:MAG: PDZ domain-containing protein [Flavobacteriales bacterium]|nr:PDZ domain-containing protein [Flavobacteriales bacterium]MEB2341932.1 PDZ domain-containing protein [Flavobacteriia bacterium]
MKTKKTYGPVAMAVCLLATACSVPAQNRVRIEIEQTTNGKTDKVVKEFTAPTQEALHDSLMALGSTFNAMGKPLLGVSLEATPQSHDGSGVRVAHVAKGSPAEKAGLHEGDRITAIGGQSVQSPQDVMAIVQAHRPGDKLEVAYDRNEEAATADVTLASREGNGLAQGTGQVPFGSNWGQWFGEAVPGGEKAFLGVRPAQEQEGHGADIGSVEPGSPAAEMGIKAGDRITGLNDVAVAGFNDLADAVADHAPGDTVTVMVQRDGKHLELKGNLGKHEGDMAAIGPFRGMPFFGDHGGQDMGKSLQDQINRMQEQMDQLWKRLEKEGDNGPADLQ